MSLVGWSLGGIYAREMARRASRLVRQVITLGSPFAQTTRGRAMPSIPTSASATCTRRYRPPGQKQIARPIGACRRRRCTPAGTASCPGVPASSPRPALHQNVEVRCSHLGFGVDPATLWLVADRLAARPGQRAPFRPPPLLRPLYPDRR
jgi:pimeloyl-ACP methyl ester carboxylesterase